jgi:polyferredoxin
VLRQLPYASLAAVAVAAYAFDSRLWTQADPFLWTFQLHGHLPGLAVLAVVLPLSVFLLRPFCRYLCPLVPIFRLLSLRPFQRRSVDPTACTGCSKGSRACSFDAIGQSGRPKRCVHDATECLGCSDCRQACPKGAIR